MDTSDGIREYLARVLPWKAGAYVNIHWARTLPGYSKPLYSGRACSTVDDAVRAVAFALKDPATQAVYACQSAQSAFEERVSKRGYKYNHAVRSAANAVAFKSLFLDIDIRPDRPDGTNPGYSSVAEAVGALAAFYKATGLPRHTLAVWSGSGLHVYWVFAELLQVSEWRSLSLALAEATKKHGLKCDTQCTVDAARILRVPGTWNKKHGDQKPVRIAGSVFTHDYTSSELGEPLALYYSQSGTPPHGGQYFEHALTPLHALPGTSDLSSGIIRSAADPTRIACVAPNCAFVSEGLTTGGKDYANPLWHLLVLITTFCEDGRTQAHAVSKGYPTYSEKETDDLFDRKEREKLERNLGWPSCQAISAAGCTACATCKNYPLGKTPLHFAKAQPIIVPANQSDLPEYYVRNPNGFILLNRTNKESGEPETVQICSYPMTDPWLQWEPHILHFETILDSGRKVTIHLTMAACGTDDGVRRVLAEQAIVLLKEEATLVQRFLVAWIQKLQKARQAVASAPFGWQVKDGKVQGFVYAGQIWSDVAPAPATNPDPILARQYAPTGDEAKWRKACELITSQGRPGLDVLVASAFAAPLVRFTGQPGLLLSTFSEESGIGKTTALKVAQAVWGDPVRAMQGLSDTQNSVLKKIGEIRTLPLYWDELKTEDDTSKFVNLIFQLSRGVEKSRLTSATAIREAGVWQTLMASASNESLIDYVVGKTKMTTAGLYRVFEFELEPSRTGKGQIAPAEAQRTIAALNENYGAIGLKYAQWLGANHERCDKDISDYLAELGDKVKIQNDERFWSALVSSVVVGSRYANELGFTDFDLKALEAFMLTTLKNMRQHRTAQPVDMKKIDNVMQTLAHFLNTHRRNTLLTDKIMVGARPKRGDLALRSDASKLDNLKVHIGLDNKVVRISSTALADWLEDQSMPKSQFFMALERQVGVKKTKVALGAGTPYGGFPEWCLELDFAGRTDISFLEQ